MKNEKIEQTNKPMQGTWDNIMSMTQPKLKFEKFNTPELVTIDCIKPREVIWDDAVFYVFDVIHNGEKKQMSTSAWTLLKGIKTFEPIKGKTLRITKKMLNGKQIYTVENIDNDLIEVEVE